MVVMQKNVKMNHMARPILKIALSCLLALPTVSCAERGGDETVSFSIAPTVAETVPEDIAQSGTRAKVTGAFPSGSMIGLRITAPSATLSSVYNNFFAAFNGSAWFYYLDNVNAGDRLSGFSNWGTISVDGYYPYSNTVTDLSEIPFRIAALNGGVAEGTEVTVGTDYMVAATQTKNMIIPDPAGAIPLQFGHLMTAIEFEMNRSSSGVPLLVLTDVTFRISGGAPARKFTVSGKYDAISPDMGKMTNNITVGDTADTMFITYPSAPKWTSSSVVRVLLVMMPEIRKAPTDDDATITMTFRFNDQDGAHYLFEDIAGGDPSITFNLSDISNAGNDDGLLAGWSYAVKATLGYYTKFAAPTTGTPMPPHVNYVGLTDDPNNEFVNI